MRITKDSVVVLDYILKNDSGEVMDESGDDPLIYMHGHGQIVIGLESALDGKTAGSKVQVSIAPKDGYGEKSTSQTVQIPKDELPEGAEPDVGMALDAVGEDGKTITLWVIEANEQGIVVSVDHPLAGLTLHFDVTIKEVRPATKDELAHGHAHGADGHHQH